MHEREQLRREKEKRKVYLVEYLTGYQKMLGSSPSPKSMILRFKLFILVKTCHCGIPEFRQ